VVVLAADELVVVEVTRVVDTVVVGAAVVVATEVVAVPGIH